MKNKINVKLLLFYIAEIIVMGFCLYIYLFGDKINVVFSDNRIFIWFILNIIIIIKYCNYLEVNKFIILHSALILLSIIYCLLTIVFNVFAPIYIVDLFISIIVLVGFVIDFIFEKKLKKVIKTNSF
jgi:hypothetical protein